ncbi:hypothetical protein [Promicromonospora iranensis]|nr:hypothetical protein [Promicromonospora iranensis]
MPVVENCHTAGAPQPRSPEADDARTRAWSLAEDAFRRLVGVRS